MAIKKKTKLELQIAKVEAIMRHVDNTLKSRRVDQKKPFIIFVDEGGKYLDDRSKADEKVIFVTIGWTANNELKEAIFKFDEKIVAMMFARAFKVKYINTRLGEAFV